MSSFLLNQQLIQTKEPAGMVLLEFIRDVQCLSGTKEACREGECGACTVLVGTPRDGGIDYRACASCLLPLGDAEGCHVVTVEGLAGDSLTLVQQLIVDYSASQCGFCTPGIVLSLTGFALNSPDCSYADAIDALDGNICRCTGYAAIRNAARALSERLQGISPDPQQRVAALIDKGVLPAWFTQVPQLLTQVQEKKVPATDGILVGGGTDLFVQKPDELLEKKLCFLSQRRDLDYIRADGGLLRIGSAVTLEQLRLAPETARHFPALRQDLLLHSSTILRNKATLTGNIVNASPIGDMSIILLALDAQLTIAAKDGKIRTLPLDRFYQGYKKYDLACGEMISEVAIPMLPAGARYSFEKVSNRVYLDIAAVNSALRLTLDQNGKISDLRLSAGGVAPVPLLVPGLERFLGKPPDPPALAQAVADAVAPIDDVRGSAAYKKLLLRQLVLAHFATAEEVAQ